MAGDVQLDTWTEMTEGHAINFDELHCVAGTEDFVNCSLPLFSNTWDGHEVVVMAGANPIIVHISDEGGYINAGSADLALPPWTAKTFKRMRTEWVAY